MAEQSPTAANSMYFRELWQALRAFALTLPNAVEEHPWGESAMKVNKKVFLFLSLEPTEGSVMRFTVKLPETGSDVLNLPFAEPSGYGLGKSGWLTFTFQPGDQADPAMIQPWILESYRAVAPKKLVAQLPVS